MKVMCVTVADFSGGNAMYKHPDIKVGDTYTVAGDCVGYGKNGLHVDCYILQEFEPSDYAFDKRNFSPLTGVDESELVNTKEESYA
jgi:hypothetical protein